MDIIYRKGSICRKGRGPVNKDPSRVPGAGRSPMSDLVEVDSRLP
jgi:hypothetical protein